MQLSNNFTLEELCVTSTGIENKPLNSETDSLKKLACNILQPARDLLGLPISINSGYRCLAVNKAVGGAPNSQHTKGEAADITCKDNARLFYIILQSCDFDQLIWEFGNNEQPQWIHVSYRANGNRREVLKATKEKGKTVYIRL